MPGLVYLNEDEEERVTILPLHNLIDDIKDESIAKVFCFGAFADKISGVVYNDCTGDFPYMSLDGNVCFFVMYHYETNENSSPQSRASIRNKFWRHTQKNSNI